METKRWTNPSLPQTLYIAVVLLYMDAVFTLLFGGFTNPLVIAFAAAGVAAGFGIANEKKWGYWLAIAVASLNLLPLVIYVLSHGIGSLFKITLLINALFPVVQFALLVHPMSREYQKIWFK